MDYHLRLVCADIRALYSSIPRLQRCIGAGTFLLPFCLPSSLTLLLSSVVTESIRERKNEREGSCLSRKVASQK